MRLRVGLSVLFVVLGASGSAVAAPLESNALLDRGVLSAPTTPGSVALSGRTLVAAAHPSPFLPEQGMGAAYVYEKSGRSWSGEAPVATLVGSDVAAEDFFGEYIAVSGTTIAVLAAHAVYVYSEPPGGWSGVLHESAKLLIAHGSSAPTGLAATESTVAVLHDGDVHLHTRPAAGWSGTISESAVLSAGGNASVSVAMSDAAITAVGENVSGGNGAPLVEKWSVDTFRPPAGGWSGVISPASTATLVIPPNVDMRSAILDGRDAIALGYRSQGPLRPRTAAAYLFPEPTPGWARSVRVASKTVDQPVPATDTTGDLRASATRITIDLAVSGDLDGSWSHRIIVFDKPSGGWPPIISPTETGPDVLTVPVPAGPGNAELDGDEVLMPVPRGILHVRVEPPAELTHAELTGVIARRPRMKLALRAGADGSPLRRFAITLPAGLRLISPPAARQHLSVSPRAARASLSATHDGYTVTLCRPARQVSLTLTAGALTAQPGLTRRIARLQRSTNRLHRNSRLTVKLGVHITDTAAVTTSRSTAITITLRPHH